MLKTLALLAFGAEFLSGGMNQVKRPEHYAGRAQAVGVPASADFVRGCGMAMIAAAICLQIPFLRRPAALVLAALLPPITYIGHRYWEIEDPQQRSTQLTQVFKNTTMFGGALFIAASK
jgi:putative oxidoreductase